MMHALQLLSILHVVQISVAKVSFDHSDLGLCGFSHQTRTSLLPICCRNDSLSGDYPYALYVRDYHTPDQRTSASVRNTESNSSAQHWSAAPKCIQHGNGFQSYCAYTSITFARNRGMSIFTAPDKVEAMLNMPAFTDQNLHSGINEGLEPPYVAKQMPIKGVGLVANRTLHRGDRIFSNTPALIVEVEMFTETEPSDRLPLLHYAIQNLPRPLRHKFLNLRGHFGRDKVADIIDTNSFAVHIFDDDNSTLYHAIIPEISRLNHDCRPNAHFYFDSTSLTLHVHALRTIVPGEEITISYIDPKQPRVTRRAALHYYWGFHCACSACSLPDALAKASDDRINHIIALQSQFDTERRNARDDVTAAGAGPQSLARRSDMAHLLVSLYEQERLLSPMAEAYTRAAVAANEAGDEWAVQKWAQKALEAGVLYWGLQDKTVRNIEILLANSRNRTSRLN